MNTKKQHVAEIITKAFSNVEHPGDARLVSSWGWEDLRKRLTGKQWTDLSVPELRYTVEEIGALTSEAYRYFLPAYLVASVIHYDEADIVPHSVVSRLTPPAESGPSMERFIERHDRLSVDQKRAIKAFLEYLAAEHGKDFFEEEPNTVLL